MSELFHPSAGESAAIPEVLRLFVDEAGDPVLFHSSGKPIVDTRGCTRFFMLGKLEVENPAALAEKLTALRQELLADPYFAGVESFKPQRKKTALLFHAKDDLPEVRYRVFELLRQQGSALRFHAVVADKVALLKRELARREARPGYRYDSNTFYDYLVGSLFDKFHRLADRYELCIAKRGHKDRNHAIVAALETAERRFEQKFGFSRGGKDAWNITISNPRSTVCLQAADYFLWAVQRFYEVKRDARSGGPAVDATTNLPIREDRYLNLLRSQIVEVHDLDFGASHGTFFNPKVPLTLEARFGKPAKKKKKS